MSELIQGNCLEILPTLKEESVDLIVTDPPYGLEFMGKDWDKAVPPIEVWKECLRVLKSGAFAFIMSSPRLDCLGQMAINLQKAGFNVGFTPLYWTFASGFPKSENISLAIDKRECRRQLTEKLGRHPTKEEFNEAWNNFRERLHTLNEKRFKKWKETDGVERKTFGQVSSEPISNEAKLLDGSYGGFQVKPSVEVVIVAQKPLKHKTYVDQALDWVTQRINVLREIEEQLHRQGVERVEWEE